MIEVEIKFRVPDDSLVDRLTTQHGFTFGEPVIQRDIYFNHPQRNFRETDEALRLRIAGDQNALTYKAPRIDTFTRTRPETEIPFLSGTHAAKQLESVLLSLGFRIIESVVKTRRTAEYQFEGTEIEITLDEVAGLGKFMEIETMAHETDWEDARDRIVRLAELWEILPLREPRSYLRMLLEQQGVLPG